MPNQPAAAERLAKARKLLEALAEECETRGGEHAWRRCRACLAREELDHRGVKALLREYLATPLMDRE